MRVTSWFVLALALAALFAEAATYRVTQARTGSLPVAAGQTDRQSDLSRRGIATFYGAAFGGHIMANGSVFDANDATIAAANDWVLGTHLRVRRIPGGPWDETLSPDERRRYFSAAITVTVTDRGDFGHDLDLSRTAFTRLGRLEEGVISVLIEPVGDTAQSNSSGSKNPLRQ